MHGFAERFRNESTLALDIIIDPPTSTLPTAFAVRFFRFIVNH